MLVLVRVRVVLITLRAYHPGLPPWPTTLAYHPGLPPCPCVVLANLLGSLLPCDFHPVGLTCNACQGCHESSVISQN